MNIILAILWAIFGIITAITVGLFVSAIILNTKKNKNNKNIKNNKNV